VDDKTNEIKQRIDAEREKLGRNFDEIEDRVRDATDLKGVFDRNTGLILGSAVAGGVLLAMALSKPSASGTAASMAQPAMASHFDSPRPPRPKSRHAKQISETFDNIVEGLIAVGAGKLVAAITKKLPSFEQEYRTGSRGQDSPTIH
jgi:hypothetical protein